VPGYALRTLHPTGLAAGSRRDRTRQALGVMRDLAGYADDSAWDSLWVYDHFHTVPMPTGEATHEA
ncbi:MAG: hypothetical protein ACRDRT_05825, partial [Pseudonocardiaceae bacterium]